MKLRVNSIIYTLIIAVFFTLLQNLALWVHLKDLFAITPAASTGFVISIPIVVLAIMNAIFTLLVWPYVHRVIIALVIILSTFATYAMYNYGAYFNYGMIVNVFETNSGEAGSYFSVTLLLWIITLAVIPIFLLSRFRVAFQSSVFKEVAVKVVSILVSLIVIVFIAMIYYKDYASLVRNHNEIKALINPTNYLTSGFRYGKYQLVEADMPFTEIGNDATDEHNKNDKKNVLVLVVGEASRSMNYSLNGYSRQTNPQLAQQDVISFKNVSSCGTATAVSLPCMFSDMTKATYNATIARHQEGLLDVLQHSGINVLWKDNDGGCKGACDRVKHIEMSAEIDSSLCHSGSCYDGILLEQLKEYIGSLEQDSVVVLHLIGSHGPTYNDRYPDEFKVFKPTCNTSEIQGCSKEELLNTYDNSILYTDHILNSVITILKNDESSHNTAMFYLADHGESLGEEGVYLHGLPYNIAPKEQTTVPMIMWLSPQFQQDRHIDSECLSKEAEVGGYSQDNLFHSVLGMMDVKTAEYKPELDIFSTCEQSAK